MFAVTTPAENRVSVLSVRLSAFLADRSAQCKSTS
ncbi:MAG: hypothetical protein JWL77_495 [Chthonomonadaceae bacterium]|nr:hypothetical protein [Chthonomonadaceae bacterium]